ncbi:MAG: hypothetical protein CVU11_13455 [Bacteroidetes bacterium HGW-Bacteroidetes-6]|nr:MAG: hypothetical protein CVU11_13455 [Bacteroidetes bacterium HGW-Bacteroidetes-6]
MWRAAKPVRAGTSAAIILMWGNPFFKRSAAKYGSEADPGTSPTPSEARGNAQKKIRVKR